MKTPRQKKDFIRRSVVLLFLTVALTLGAFMAAHAQAPVPEKADSASPSVMIIPFDPYMYFSDADEQLAKYNQKSVKEVRTLFRYGLNLNVNAKIMSAYQTRPLLTDTAKSAVEDLYQIYKGISYFQDKSIPVLNPEDIKNSEAADKKKVLTLKKKPDESEAQTASAHLKKPDVTHEYMNVKIHDKKMLPYLREKYGTDIFVFINQFELATNYQHCLDRSTNTFERDIKVHFSVLDYNGKQLAGDVAIVHFPSNSNDITEIMRDNFPLLADYLAGKMNSHVKPVKPAVSKTAGSNEELQFMEFEK